MVPSYLDVGRRRFSSVLVLLPTNGRSASFYAGEPVLSLVQIYYQYGAVPTTAARYWKMGSLFRASQPLPSKELFPCLQCKAAAWRNTYVTTRPWCLFSENQSSDYENNANRVNAKTGSWQ